MAAAEVEGADDGGQRRGKEEEESERASAGGGLNRNRAAKSPIEWGRLTAGEQGCSFASGSLTAGEQDREFTSGKPLTAGEQRPTFSSGKVFSYLFINSFLPTLLFFILIVRTTFYYYISFPNYFVFSIYCFFCFLVFFIPFLICFLILDFKISQILKKSDLIKKCKF